MIVKVILKLIQMASDGKITFEELQELIELLFPQGPPSGPNN